MDDRRGCGGFTLAGQPEKMRGLRLPQEIIASAIPDASKAPPIRLDVRLRDDRFHVYSSSTRSASAGRLWKPIDPIAPIASAFFGSLERSISFSELLALVTAIRNCCFEMLTGPFEYLGLRATRGAAGTI